jgi:MFS family permease
VSEQTRQQTRLPEHSRLWSARTWPFIVSVLVLMTFIAFEAFAVTTVLPVAMADLDGSGWYSLAFAATISTGLVGMIIGGNWSDRSGPRRALIVGGSVFLLGIALCVVAPNAGLFIVGRLLQGIGGGIDSVVLYVLIARVIPAPSRPAMFGLLTTAWLLPSMAGPVVAGTLAELTSWRAVFAVILVGSGIALAGLLRTTVADDGRGDPEAPIIGRKGLLAVAAAGLLVALHLGAQLDGTASYAVVLVGILALVQVARMLLPPGTLRLRGGAQRMVALRAGFGVTSAVPDVYLTLYLQSQLGLSPTLAGLIIAVGAGGWAVGSWVQSRFPSTQVDHRRLILWSAPLVAAAPIGALLLTLGLVPLAVVVLTAVLKGVGMGIASARIATATLDLAQPREHGAFSSALQAGESIGVAAATAVMASILATGGAVPSTFVIVYVVLTAGSLITALIALSTARNGVHQKGGGAL